MDTILVIVGAAVAGPVVVFLSTSIMNLYKERMLLKRDVD